MSLTINIHCNKSAAQVQAVVDTLKARHPDYYSHDFLIWDAAPVTGRRKEVPQSFGFESESCVVVALNNSNRAGPDYDKAIEIICKELGESNCLVLFQNESVYRYSDPVGQDPKPNTPQES